MEGKRRGGGGGAMGGGLKVANDNNCNELGGVSRGQYHTTMNKHNPLKV